MGTQLAPRRADLIGVRHQVRSQEDFRGQRRRSGGSSGAPSATVCLVREQRRVRQHSVLVVGGQRGERAIPDVQVVVVGAGIGQINEEIADGTTAQTGEILQR